MVIEWDTHACFRELPAWVSPASHLCKLRFLTPGSKLCLNNSRPESCTTDNHSPPEHQAASGEKITPTTVFHFLRSPPGSISARVDNKEENTETESHVEAYQAETLCRWPAHHQHQFRHRLVEEDLGPCSLDVIGGHQSQAGMTT